MNRIKKKKKTVETKIKITIKLKNTIVGTGEKKKPRIFKPRTRDNETCVAIITVVVGREFRTCT